MIDPNDQSFAEQLERAIRLTLSGDEKLSGLYRSVLSSNSWDMFNQTRGAIHAYEEVLAEMRRIVRRMNGEPDERRRQETRTMN